MIGRKSVIRVVGVSLLLGLGLDRWVYLNRTSARGDAVEPACRIVVLDSSRGRVTVFEYSVLHDGRLLICVRQDLEDSSPIIFAGSAIPESLVGLAKIGTLRNRLIVVSNTYSTPGESLSHGERLILNYLLNR